VKTAVERSHYISPLTTEQLKTKYQAKCIFGLTHMTSLILLILLYCYCSSYHHICSFSARASGLCFVLSRRTQSKIWVEIPKGVLQCVRVAALERKCEMGSEWMSL